MDARRKLTVVSNFYVGGVANYHRNILAQDINNRFDKNIIFLHWKGVNLTKLDNGFNLCPEVVYEIDLENKKVSKELAKLIGNEKGVLITNFEYELTAMHFYPKPGKTVVYVCHDEIYVAAFKKYEFLIDVFVAHNPFFYDLIREELPWRKEDVYYLPFGVNIAPLEKKVNIDRTLNLVSLARLDRTKGIYELPLIDDLLIAKGISVNWTIIGDGPEKEEFRNLVKERKNFIHYSPTDNSAVMELLEEQDLFILPSRLDGLPVAMLETMSRGIVPIMYEFNAGIKKIITSDIGHVVKTGDNNAITEYICQFHNDRLLLSEMSQKARIKVENEYNIKKQAMKYFDLYSTIQPSFTKTKRKNLVEVYGWEAHPLMPFFLVKFYRSIKKIFKK